jgi:CPA1 family monovalent cation:H+ antiporter
LPAGQERESVLALTYVIVIFSIVVQGLTLEHVARRVTGR